MKAEVFGPLNLKANLNTTYILIWTTTPNLKYKTKNQPNRLPKLIMRLTSTLTPRTKTNSLSSETIRIKSCSSWYFFSNLDQAKKKIHQESEQRIRKRFLKEEDS